MTVLVGGFLLININLYINEPLHRLRTNLYFKCYCFSAINGIRHDCGALCNATRTTR
jgi:hypothetical protein